MSPSDDVSEVKFVSLQELGSLPLTPLVRQVLKDAGYLGEQTTTEQHSEKLQEFVLFPVPIAGAVSRQVHQRRRPTTRRSLHRGPIARQAALTFE